MKSNQKSFLIFYLIFLFFVIIWLSLIVATPCLLFINYSKTSFYLYSLFSGVCHQEDARSFHIFGLKMAVCSRCFSIYSGYLFGTLLFPLIYGFKKIKIPSLWVLILFSLPIAFDVLLDFTNILKNNFLSRFATGFILGNILPFYLIPGITLLLIELKIIRISKNN